MLKNAFVFCELKQTAYTKSIFDMLILKKKLVLILILSNPKSVDTISGIQTFKKVYKEKRTRKYRIYPRQWINSDDLR